MPLYCSNCRGNNEDNAKYCSKCGKPLNSGLSPVKPLDPGTLLENRYEIISLIKPGGSIYKSIDRKFDNICAVKEVIPQYGNAYEQQSIGEWFEKEVKNLNKLDHPNLPKVFDYFINNDRYYLVMNFPEGQDLGTILSSEGNPGLPFEKVIEWAKEILLILDYFHNQSPPIIYKDIKPSNIILHKDGRIMLMDFGIPRIVQMGNHGMKTSMGTKGYAPVELCRGMAEAGSDLYSLGATIHHLITGIEPVPFNFSPLGKIAPSVPQELDYIVMKSLKDNIKSRFSTAREMFVMLISINCRANNK